MATATLATDQVKPQAQMSITSRSTQRSEARCVVMFPNQKELLQTPDVLPKLRHLLKEAREVHPGYRIDFGLVFRDVEHHPGGPDSFDHSTTMPFEHASTSYAIGKLLRDRFVREGRGGGVYFHSYGDNKDRQVLGNNAILKVLGGDRPLAAMAINVASDSEYVSEGDVKSIASSIGNRIFGMFSDEKKAQQFEDRKERNIAMAEACASFGSTGAGVVASFLTHDFVAAAGGFVGGVSLAADGMRRSLRGLKRAHDALQRE